MRLLWIDAVQARTRTRTCTRIVPVSPRLDPSSLAVRERDTTLYDTRDDMHSPAHLVPIDVNKDGTGTSI
jgi:hypothetical protein